MIGALILIAIPLVAGLNGAPKDDVMLGTLAVGLFLVLGLMIHILFVRACFHSGNSLEIHEDKLVVAVANGLLTVPREGVRGVWGPGDHLNLPDEKKIVVNSVSNPQSRVTLAVTDDYLIRGLFGNKEYVDVATWMLDDGARNYEVAAALKAWFNAPPNR